MYYAPLSHVLLTLSVLILAMTVLCIVKVLFRQEAQYYASSVNGMLVPLKVIK